MDHQILLQRLSERFGVGEDVLSWIRSYLSNRVQRVRIGKSTSPRIALQCGVPQGSVLGPILFNMYVSPLYDIAVQHGVYTHQYADDCQLYVELKVGDDDAGSDGAITKLEECVRDIAEWMGANKLKLNEEKTEIIVFSPRNETPSRNHFQIGEVDIAPKQCVKDLGVFLEASLHAERHVNHICAVGYFHLSNIAAIRNSLNKECAEKLLHAFVTSKLDFCNSLLVFLPDFLTSKLQRLQNAVAKLVTKRPRREHVTPLLMELHWLPVRQRIRFKICCIVWKCVHGEAPDYAKSLITMYNPARDLRSASNISLVVRQPRTNLGRRAFVVAGPMIWNELPTAVRAMTDFNDFKKCLKTFLFTEAFH